MWKRGEIARNIFIIPLTSVVKLRIQFFNVVVPFIISSIRKSDMTRYGYLKIESKAMIRNRYNYPTPPIRDIKGKETQTRNNWTQMETSLAESQTDSYFPTKWPNGYPKQKDISDTHIQRRTITKINHGRRTALEQSVKSISLGVGAYFRETLRLRDTESTVVVSADLSKTVPLLQFLVRMSVNAIVTLHLVIICTSFCLLSVPREGCASQLWPFCVTSFIFVFHTYHYDNAPIQIYHMMSLLFSGQHHVIKVV